MKSEIQLLNGDCLELMKTIPDGSVDMICADLPYGTTNCAWDVRIPMEPLWEQFWRVAKHNAAICLFAQQPFAADLINAARKWFRYEWVWVKTQQVGFFNCKKMPMRLHELILVFYRYLPTYNPIMRKVEKGQLGRVRSNSDWKTVCGHIYGIIERKKAQEWKYEERHLRYPTDVLHFNNWNRMLFGRSMSEFRHPTQKPVNILEYLVKTYTDAGELVLDPTMGSGSCGVACANTGRRFVGMEKDAHFFEVAQRRVEKAAALVEEAPPERGGQIENREEEE